MKAKIPKAPSHLAPATRAWWAEIVGRIDLGSHNLRLLTMAGEAWDIHTKAMGQLAVEGLTFKDDRENLRPHPAVAIARDARASFAKLIRDLNLDNVVEPAAVAASHRRRSK